MIAEILATTITRVIDVDCPQCGSPSGERCAVAFCQARRNVAWARTRERNRERYRLEYPDKHP